MTNTPEKSSELIKILIDYSTKMVRTQKDLDEACEKIMNWEEKRESDIRNLWEKAVRFNRTYVDEVIDLKEELSQEKKKVERLSKGLNKIIETIMDCSHTPLEVMELAKQALKETKEK